MRTIKWGMWIAIALIGIAALDLLTGNTDKPILPSFLGNILTQQWDIVLIIVGVLLFFI